MPNQRNRYAKKATKAIFQAKTTGRLTKENGINTLVETGKDILIGVVGGGFIGAAIGRPSLIIGAVVSGVGHFIGNRAVSLAGVGMMAANGFQPSSTVSGGMDGVDGVKERLTAYKNSFTEKLYLDKILKKKTDTSVAGFGELQYFNYANEVAGLAALDNMEEQMENNAMSRLQMNGTNMGAASDDLPAVVDGVLSDVSDYNL